MRRRRWILLSFLLVVGISAGLIFFRPFASRRSPQDDVTDLTPLPGEQMTFLLMGVDKRGEDVGRSDSMIVVSYSPKDSRMALLSLPRDTWVRIPGYGYDKVNHAYAYGGEELAVTTVEQLLGIPIDHYVVLSFQGFERVIDALGGIEIDVEKRMYYVDPYDSSMGPDGLVIDLQPGPQHMDGETALKYARFRMDEEGDLGRIRRQQQVIKAIIQKATRSSVITQLPRLVTAVADAVDTDMSLSEMLKLARGVRNGITDNLVTGTLPGTTQFIGGIYYQISDLVEARNMAYRILVGAEPPEEFVAKARSDQMAYQEALEKAIVAAVPKPQQEQQDTDGQNPKPEEGTGDGAGTSEPGTGDESTNPGNSGPADGAGGTGGTGEGNADNEGNQDGEGNERDDEPDDGMNVDPRTIFLIDASGRDLADDYADLLVANGYTVVVVEPSDDEVQPVSLVLVDYPGQSYKLQGLIPGVAEVLKVKPGHPQGTYLILGANLAQ